MRWVPCEPVGHLFTEEAEMAGRVGEPGDLAEHVLSDVLEPELSCDGDGVLERLREARVQEAIGLCPRECRPSLRTSEGLPSRSSGQRSKLIHPCS